MEIEYDDSLEFVRLFGYEPRFGKNKITVPLDDLNHGATQVILTRFRLPKAVECPAEFSVTARIQYLDLRTEKMKSRKKTAALTVRRKAEPTKWDHDVAKNYTIALLAQSIKEMSVSFQKKNYGDAKRVLDSALCEARERFPDCQDKDILRVVDIAETYSRRLGGALGAKFPK